MKNLFLLFLLLSSFSLVFSQEYVQKLSKDGILFEYKLPEKASTKNESLEIQTIVSNTNKYPVRVTFSVEYLLNGELQEAMDKTSICLVRKGFPNAKQVIFLTTQNIDKNNFDNPKFDWKIEDLSIKKVEGCK
ncbi:MAG: hypothetical protein HUU48_12840 [Flavobacteriales bacterium]|nr:hypothetical protein [Flavobacteriales bacterium]